MANLVRNLFAAAVVVAATAGSGQAAFVNGTFAGTFGSSSITAPAGETKVQNATEITVSTPFVINSSIPPTFGGNPNDLSSTNNVFPSQNVGFSPTTITIDTLATSSPLVLEFGEIAPGVYRFRYESDAAIDISRLALGSGGILSYATTGVLTDLFPAGSTGTQFGSTQAGLSIQFIQETDGGAISGSFSFSASGVQEIVPEPASLALAGVAAAGFGVRRLRRRTAKA